MASAKDIFEANIFEANIFASGMFRGIGVAADPPTVPGLEFNFLNNRMQFNMQKDQQHYRVTNNKFQFTLPKDK